jgi:hypothetical protein
MRNGRGDSEEDIPADRQFAGIHQDRWQGVRKSAKPTKIFHFRERCTAKKTLELIIVIVDFATEILVMIKDKLKNGRKNDDKGASKKE